MRRVRFDKLGEEAGRFLVGGLLDCAAEATRTEHGSTEFGAVEAFASGAPGRDAGLARGGMA